MFDANIILKRPVLTNTRAFGVELEMSTDFNTVKSVVMPMLSKRALIVTECVTDSINKRKWYLKRDGTTETELTTPAINLKSPEYKLLKQVLRSLISNNVVTTKVDGLHIHVDCSDVTISHLVAAWIYLETAIIRLFPKYRSVNNYQCYSKRVVLKDSSKRISDCFEHALSTTQIEKYTAISLRHYKTRKTVEFRLAEGSLNFKDIDSWIKLLLLLIDFSKNSDICKIMSTRLSDRPVAKDLCDVLGVSDNKVRNWVNDRKMTFSMEF